MEYLMTYGWAILIIAVVLGALFSLGVFNGANFAPKAPPGACQVFRPNGPGSTSFINLEGVCSGELPQYVGQFNGTIQSNIYSYSDPVTSLTAFTITAYVDESSFVCAGPAYNIFTLLSSSATLFFNIGNCGGGPGFVYIVPSCGASYYFSSNTNVDKNNWYFIAGTWDSATNTINFYQDGAPAGSASGFGFTSYSITGFFIGGPTCGTQTLYGSLANVQLYNTPLSANDINALYQEGIGGAPIDLQNLVGWWPLNGNGDDYSGNNNNGQATHVIYTSSWTNGYATP